MDWSSPLPRSSIAQVLRWLGDYGSLSPHSHITERNFGCALNDFHCLTASLTHPHRHRHAEGKKEKMKDEDEKRIRGTFELAVRLMLEGKDINPTTFSRLFYQSVAAFTSVRDAVGDNTLTELRDRLRELVRENPHLAFELGGRMMTMARFRGTASGGRREREVPALHAGTHIALFLGHFLTYTHHTHLQNRSRVWARRCVCRYSKLGSPVRLRVEAAG